MIPPIHPGPDDLALPCSAYPECGQDCTHPQCTVIEKALNCPEGHGVMRPANRRERRRQQFRPYQKERPPWTAADRSTPIHLHPSGR